MTLEEAQKKRAALFTEVYTLPRPVNVAKVKEIHDEISAIDKIIFDLTPREPILEPKRVTRDPKKPGR